MSCDYYTYWTTGCNTITANSAGNDTQTTPTGISSSNKFDDLGNFTTTKGITIQGSNIINGPGSYIGYDKSPSNDNFVNFINQTGNTDGGFIFKTYNNDNKPDKELAFINNRGDFITTGDFTTKRGISIQGSNTINGTGSYIGYNNSKTNQESNFINSNDGTNNGGFTFDTYSQNKLKQRLGYFDNKGNFQSTGVITSQQGFQIQSNVSAWPSFTIGNNKTTFNDLDEENNLKQTMIVGSKIGAREIKLQDSTYSGSPIDMVSSKDVPIKFPTGINVMNYTSIGGKLPSDSTGTILTFDQNTNETNIINKNCVKYPDGYQNTIGGGINFSQYKNNDTTKQLGKFDSFGNFFTTGFMQGSGLMSVHELNRDSSNVAGEASNVDGEASNIAGQASNVAVTGINYTKMPPGTYMTYNENQMGETTISTKKKENSFGGVYFNQINNDGTFDKNLASFDGNGVVYSNAGIGLSNNPLYLRSSPTNMDNLNTISYSSDIDGPNIKGNSGGKLSTASADIAKWSNKGLSLVNGGVFIPGQPMVDKDTKKTLNKQGAYIGWNMNVGQGETNIINNRGGGPGGIYFDQYNPDNTYDKRLGSFDGSGNFNVTGKIYSGNDSYLNNYSLYLRREGDTNHQIQYSGDVDGPKIRGYGGGKLSTASADIAKWSNNGLSLVNGSVFIPGGPMIDKDKKTLNSQGAYIGWNMNVGQGETNIINNRGGGPGGIYFDQYNSDNTYDKRLGSFDGSGNFNVTGKITSSGIIAGSKTAPTAPATNASLTNNNVASDICFNDSSNTKNKWCIPTSTFTVRQDR